MTQPVRSVLAGDYWAPGQARNQLESLHVNLPALHADLNKALAPVSVDWLQMRLRLMWKSCNPGGGLDATAWLHETGRLLSDLPQDILAEAIDAAVRASARGFMPSVGEIRAYAEQRLRERRQQEWRVSEVMKFSTSAPLAKEDRCTPEEAERIRKAAGIRYDDDGREKPANWIPVEQRTAPIREDYIRWGIPV